MNDKPHITQQPADFTFRWRAEWFGVRGYGHTPSQAYGNLLNAPINLTYIHPRNLNGTA